MTSSNQSLGQAISRSTQCDALEVGGCHALDEFGEGFGPRCVQTEALDSVRGRVLLGEASKKSLTNFAWAYGRRAARREGSLKRRAAMPP